jgi:hypothetical protein
MNKDDIPDTLNKLKKYCQHVNCIDCYFTGTYGHCYFSRKAPKEWNTRMIKKIIRMFMGGNNEIM